MRSTRSRLSNRRQIFRGNEPTFIWIPCRCRALAQDARRRRSIGRLFRRDAFPPSVWCSTATLGGTTPGRTFQGRCEERPGRHRDMRDPSSSAEGGAGDVISRNLHQGTCCGLGLREQNTGARGLKSPSSASSATFHNNYHGCARRGISDNSNCLPPQVIKRCGQMGTRPVHGHCQRGIQTIDRQ